MLILFFLSLFLTGCQGDNQHVVEMIQLGTGADMGPWVSILSLEPFRICITWLSEIQRSFKILTGWELEKLGNELQAESEGVVHRVKLEIPAGKTLYYRIEPDLACCQGEVFSVATPEVSTPLRISILGDMQPQDESTRQSNRLMLDAVIESQPDFVIQVGDILERGSEIKNWRLLMQELPRLAAGVPMALVPGNHDMKWDDGANWDCGFGQEFESDLDGRHRVLRWKNARFIMLQAYYGPLSARDLKWLTRVLDQALLDDAWRFVFFHGAILSSGTENTDQALLAQLVPLFDRAKVHAVFYGHDHFYEHYEVTYGPWLFDPRHRPTGHRVHYFLTGGGGARLEHEYGLLDPRKMRRTTKLELVHAETSEKRTFPFARRPWNPDRVKPQADPEWSRGGAAWYQDCTEEVYQDDAAFWGHQYGENVLHYLTLEVGEDEALVEVRYPDGSVLSGPSGEVPQRFPITRLT